MSRIASHGEVRQREPRVRDKGHLGFVAALPCVACARHGRGTWPVEVAHIKIGIPETGWRAFGHAERAHDWRTAPLCSVHHRTGQDAQHQNRRGDERDWWVALGIYPPDFCDALVAARAEGQDGRQVIASAARGKFPWPSTAPAG